MGSRTREGKHAAAFARTHAPENPFKIIDGIQTPQATQLKRSNGRVLLKKSKQHVPASEQGELITRNGSLCGDVRHKSISCPRGQARNGAAHSNWDSKPDADVSGLPEELIIH